MPRPTDSLPRVRRALWPAALPAALPVVLLVCALCGAAAGQRPGQAPYVFKAVTSEVLVHASVTDKKGRPVDGLGQADFKVLEDDVPQRVDYFSHSDAPVSVGIVIDDSGSMRDKRAEVNAAALNFVRASNPQDEVFIVNFNDEYYLDADFTSSIPALQQGLEHISSTGGTALYDAVIASLDHLEQGKRDKKVLLVISDGADNDSRYHLEDVVRIAQNEHGPLIYCIGLSSPDDIDRKQAQRALKRLAQATGGAAYFPKDLSQVDEITRSVAAAIRDQYTLGYRPTQKQAGFHAIRVELVGPHTHGLHLTARTGYYRGPAPPPSARQPSE